MYKNQGMNLKTNTKTKNLYFENVCVYPRATFQNSNFNKLLLTLVLKDYKFFKRASPYDLENLILEPELR